MTCCIGYKLKEGIVLVADSAGTDEDDNQTIRSDSKLGKIGDFIFAISGSFRLRDILYYDFVIPKKNKNESIDKYMRSKFISKLRDVCIKKGITKEENGEEELIGEILVGYKNKLYHIESDFQVGESIDDFVTIGSGSQLALGALSAVNTFDKKLFEKTKIKNTLFKILDVASKYKSSVKGPYIYLTNFGDLNND